MTRRGERGLALVVVLLGVAALSLIAFAMLASSVTATRIARNDWARLQVTTAANSAVQAAILSLFDPVLQDLPPLDGAARSSTAGDVDLSTAIQDETGRVDLNVSGRDLLRSYFAAAGDLEVAPADALAGNVIAWRTTHGAFQSVEDLGGVDGMTPDLIVRVVPGLTVYSHRESFDLRTAPPPVLRAIPGMSATGLRGRGIVRPGRAYSIHVAASRGATRVERLAVVLITGDPAKPYWLLDWR
ncbi:MAG TPA: hypothetical protein VG387_15620 [Rhizomicrobium sp.]|jgi:general secretion pathway protein K|nr:hypothetical protein [Rhizomicrobium sp.]